MALVTGGSRGIGKTIALDLARRGANIAFNYLRSYDAAAQTEKEIKKLGVDCLSIKAHVGNPDKIKDLFNRIEEKYGQLDILVNNAATGVQRNAIDLDAKHWDWTMSVNARGPWLCSIEAARLMKNGGCIVNISSLGSRRVLPYYFSVGTSKATLEAITKYLAVELAPLNIRVNAISGGYVETDAFDSFPNKEDMVAATETTITTRSLNPQDLANAVAFLCSNESEMIRGHILVVDGGVTLTA
ncbi:MAG: enoyl-[acyl-carrier protein] reductase III [Chloroflexi bacterium]|nr:MAG: enoyl-[acyl-carrier protein] reductase III [Chloroflexota bacterium]